ncbi:MAG: two-component regulator propeller domain-containing protein [Bryobacteraceae bacterium]
MKRIGRVVGWLLVGFCLKLGFALDRQKAITQFVHTSWTEQQGAPSNVIALAQTSDGFLWLGTRTGLFHFDGIRFARFESGAGESLPVARIRALLATRNDALWIVFESGRVSRILKGHVTSYSEGDGLPATFALAERSDGLLLAATASGLASFGDGIWKDAGKAWNYQGKLARWIYFDREDTLWIVTEDKILHLPLGQNRLVDSGERVDPVYGFAQAPNGAIWIAETSRSAHTLARSQGHGAMTEVRVGATSVLFDRDGSLWIGSAGDGLRRIAYPERIAGRQIAEYGPEAEQFTAKDGLSGNYVYAELEDHEGDIWVGTPRGIDRFRETTFTAVSIPRQDDPRSLLATSDGSLWVYSLSAQVLRIGPQGREQTYPGGEVASGGMCESPDGTVWLVRLPSGLLRLRHGRFISIPLPRSAALDRTAGITCDKAGGIWLLDLRKGLFRFAKGVATKVMSQPDPVNPWGYLYPDRRGRIWVGQNGRITVYNQNRCQSFGTGDGVPPGAIFSIYEDGGGSVWAGGEGGLSRFENGRFAPLSKPYGLPARSVFGVAEDDEGYWWIATEAGVIRMAAADLNRAAVDPTYRSHYKSFSMLDGLPGGPVQSFPMPVVSRTTDGRIWFATNNGLAYADPKSIPKNNLPPPVEIEAVRIDGKQLPPKNRLVLENKATNIEIDYTALSLSIPERVLFRYKLEGVDRNWQDVGRRRQAFYNRLAPKRYRFRVIACNNDGVWNDVGASWTFRVAPAFYQTVWFELLCVLAACLVLALVHRLRVRQIASAMNARFDERVAERTRLAQDFHDTLLQTVQGSKLVADDALQQPPDQIRMRDAMEQLSGWLARAVDEGRSALSSLRNATTEQNDLVASLQRAGEECRFHRPIDFLLSVGGASREMHPIVRDEVYRIGYEAIRNACLHSEGNRVNVELSYVEDLVLRIFDNGTGIPADVALKGKAGHFGLTGMYERAARLRGRLTVSSSPRAGTQIELVVPDRIAFLRPDPHRRKRFRRFRLFF